MKFTKFDVLLAVFAWGFLVWRLWYGEKIGEDRLDRHVQKLFPEDQGNDDDSE
jgi:hypothetical protein